MVLETIKNGFGLRMLNNSRMTCGCNKEVYIMAYIMVKSNGLSWNFMTLVLKLKIYFTYEWRETSFGTKGQHISIVKSNKVESDY